MKITVEMTSEEFQEFMTWKKDKDISIAKKRNATALLPAGFDIAHVVN